MNIKNYIILVAGIILSIFFIIAKVTLLRKSRLSQKKLDDIFATWTKIKIHVSECLIKTNNYSHEVEIESGRAAAINGVFGKDIDNVRVEDVFQTVLYCTKVNPNDGKTYTYYSSIINKDKKTIEIYCSLDKTIDLYINPLNAQEYYFNISTLFE